MTCNRPRIPFGVLPRVGQNRITCLQKLLHTQTYGNVLSGSEGSGLPAESPLGRAGRNALRGSNDIVHGLVRRKSITECVGRCTSVRLALCPRRSNCQHGRHKTCPCTCRSQHKVGKGPRCCLPRAPPWPTWARMGALFGTTVETWAPEMTLDTLECIPDFMQMCEIYS